MSKKSLFISHSGKDKLPLIQLKKLIESSFPEIEVFLSSDGESIRLGKNWSSEIENALEASRFALIVLTKNSLQNNWIHFEAGYLYSKVRTKIIPILFGEVMMEDLSPPLSLLQATYLNNENGLIRIQQEIQDHLDLTPSRSFTAEDFASIINAENRALEESLNFHHITITIKGNAQKAHSCIINEFNNIYDVVKAHNDGSTTRNIWPGGIVRNWGEDQIEIELSPLNSFDSLTILNRIFASFSTQNTEICTNIHLPKSFKTWNNIYDIYAKIEGSLIKLLENEELAFDGTKFRVYNDTDGSVIISVLKSKWGPVIPTPTYVNKLIEKLLQCRAVVDSGEG